VISLEQLQFLPIVVIAGCWMAGARTDRRRGRPVELRRHVLVGGALVLLLAAALPPIEPLSDRLFLAHMSQHLLLGDLAPLCLALAVSGPTLRPLLTRSTLRRARWLLHPAIALSVWAADLLAWHTPRLYDAALRSDAVHALEHLCFFAAGLLMWMAVIETLPAPAWFTTPWKVGYVFAVRLVGMGLGNVYFWADLPIYPAYLHTDRPFGLSAQTDQQIAGAIMMMEGSVITIVVLVWLALRYLSQAESGQLLAERGGSPRQVARAVRYNRASDELRG
jgi:putative membrane protein